MPPNPERQALRDPPPNPWLALVWIGLALMLAVPLWGAWFGAGGPGAAPQTPAAASGALRAGDRAAPPLPAAPASAQSSGPGPRASASATGAHTPSAPGLRAAASPAPGVAPQRAATMQVCGMGDLALAPPRSSGTDEPDEPADLPPGVSQELLALWWPRLVAGLQAGTERQRAAAVLLQPAGGLSPAMPDPAALAGLTRLARASADLQVQDWALRACSQAAYPAACAGWTAREAVNRSPQLALAWQQLLQQEPQATDEALAGLAQATVWDTGYGRLAGELLAVWPPDAPQHLKFMASLTALGLDAALLTGAGPGVLRVCGTAAQASPSRQAQCRQIAAHMLRDGRDLMTLMVGSRLGERFGLPTAVWAPARGLLEAAPKIPAPLMRHAEQPLSCAAIADWSLWVQDLAREGEVPLLRAATGVAPQARSAR